MQRSNLVPCILVAVLSLLLCANAQAKTSKSHKTGASSSKTVASKKKLGQAVAVSHGKHSTKLDKHAVVKHRAKVIVVKPAQVGVSYEAETEPLLKAYRLHVQASSDEQSGNYAQSILHLQQAVNYSESYWGTDSPLLANLYFDLGRVLRQSQLPNEAKAAYLHGLELNPHQYKTYLELAGLTAGQGRVREGISYARQAIELRPQDPQGHLTLSWLLQKSGQMSQARQELERGKQLLKNAQDTMPPMPNP